MDAQDLIDLADWRRKIAELYVRIRSLSDPLRAWDEWCRTRADMFRSHAQSPIPPARRNSYGGPPHFRYDHRFRTAGVIEEAPTERVTIPSSVDTTYEFTRFATVSFELGGKSHRLDLLWLDSYGGGIFLSFRDSTSGDSTYRACRYLFDTAKGADLGMVEGRLLLDFNFAYNPSCAYDAKWACPLAPPRNRMDLAIEAGERLA